MKGGGKNNHLYFIRITATQPSIIIIITSSSSGWRIGTATIIIIMDYLFFARRRIIIGLLQPVQEWLDLLLQTFVLNETKVLEGFCHEIFKNRIFTRLAPLIADYTSWQEYSSYTPCRCPSDLLRRVRLGGIMVDTPELLSAHQIHRNRTVHQEVQVGEILYKINQKSPSHSTNCSRIFVIDRYSYQQYSTWKLSSPPPPLYSPSLYSQCTVW